MSSKSVSTGNVDHELSLLVIKLTTLRRKIIQRSIFVENNLFSLVSSRIVSARLNVSMTSSQVECINNQNERKLLRNLIVGINGYILLVSRQNLFL